MPSCHTLAWLEMNSGKHMYTHLIDERDADVEPSMVQRRQKAADYYEHPCGHHVHGDDEPGHQVQRQKVVVLPAEELERVDVDGVRVASGRRLLSVVVLVDVSVQAAYMQSTMEDRVEQVVHNVQSDECAEPGRESKPREAPADPASRREVPEVLDGVVGEDRGAAPVEGDEEVV